MQDNSVPSSVSMVAGLGGTNIILQPASQNQPNTQYVTLDVNNRAQIINLPQQTSQYVAVQSSGFQVIPVQNSTSSAQFVQLQLPNVQQMGSNFIQIQPTNQSGKGVINNSNLNQNFIPVQPITNQTQLAKNNQKVSIQLVQQPLSSPKASSVLGPQSLVGTKSVGESSSGIQIDESSHPHSIVYTGQNIATQSKTVTTATSSSLFQALQQAASVQPAYTAVSNIAPLNSSVTVAKNAVTKTFSSIRLPHPNLEHIMRPNVKTVTNPTTRKNENKPLQAGTFVVVSGQNQQSIVFSKTKAQTNPVFVPITMANNVSVLTNQTPALLASKRAGQTSQAIPIRVQHQIVPRVVQASISEGQATIPVNIGSLTKQLKLTPVYSTDAQQQNQQSIIFQPVQQNAVRFASQFAPSLQANKEALANIVPGPKPVRPVQPPVTIPTTISESRPVKKPCNCTKSQCLKLYCECFANGEFCNNCNCRACMNNIEHEVERSRAIKNCLERNPYAFHPKIGKGKVKGDHERRHTKGCNCKRSGCLKNYCECYEAKILCSSLCRCVGCKNFEESDDRKTLMQLADAAEARVLQQNAAKSKLNAQIQIAPKKRSHSVKESRLPLTFLTADVSKATCDILLATAVEAEKNQLTGADAEKSLIHEFSRCLDQIIDKSKEKR